MGDEIVTTGAVRDQDAGRWLSLAMLVTLHLALLTGVESIWSRPLLFAHLGLFLIWQPLWRGEEKLSTRGAVIIIGVSVVALLWLNWWILAFWVSGLFSLVGGRVFTFQSVWQRLRYLLAMGYLLAALLFWLTPQLLVLSTAGDAGKDLMQYVLPFLLLGMVLVPHENERLKKTVAVDLVYSILLFMLLILLVLGSLAFMSLGHVEYYEALLSTLFSMALLLFILGWLWNPRMGFAGIQAIFSRYFLNIGTPFELWLKQLAKTSRQEPSPVAFLKRAAEQLAALSWLSGVNWACEQGRGSVGVGSHYLIEVVEQDLRLTLYARQRVAPAVMVHINLLTQLLTYFYQAKQDEVRLHEMARLQAVHETGARLTHDLKNMLQSLLALTSIAELQPEQAQPVLQRQLPLLTQRIELILGKLKVPRVEDEAVMMPLETWWNSLQQRQHYRDLEWWHEEGLSKLSIPVTLMDSVVDNLIDNARNKRLREPEIRVSVSLYADPLRLSVCDNGSAIPARVADQLLHTVVDSEDGLGVGLFQVSRWAEQSGYQLELKENRNGRVCFVLSEKKVRKI